MLTKEELEAALSAGYELRGLEAKGPGSRTDSHLFAKVARAALSLGNIRDGGHVVIGLADDALAEMEPGLTDEQLDSWLAYDDVARKLAEYADPPLRFDVSGLDLSNSCRVALIQVMEFSDIPHICGKGYDTVLRRGAVYVRPRKVPETSEVADSVEMRELLELATEKALRRFVETAARAGLTVLPGDATERPPSAAERYEHERREAWK